MENVTILRSEYGDLLLDSSELRIIELIVFLFTLCYITKIILSNMRFR